METIAGRMRACYGVGTVNICTESGNSATVEVLVVRNKTVSFELLPEIDAITALGGIHITQTVAAWFCSKEIPTCAVIHIDQPDFSVEFNHQQKKWIAVVAPGQLHSRLSEYVMDV